MKYLYPFALALFLLFGCKNNIDKTDSISNIGEITHLQIPDSVKMLIDSVVIKTARNSKSRVTAVIANDSMASYYSGFDGRENAPITEFDDLLEIGSNTKMFTATSILQLVEQNKISLDDKLTSVLKDEAIRDLLIIDGKNYIDSVKIVHLLNHSSGLPEYFIDDDDKEIELYGDPTLTFSAHDLIVMARDYQTDPFIPGSSFRYCNTNYILLGMIIDKVSGKTYQDYFQEHIIDKLQLKNTYLGTLKLPQKRSQGHFKGKETVMPFTLSGPAGEILMNLEDMVEFLDNWFKGNLYQKSSTMQSVLHDNYMEMQPGIMYGMGVINLMNKTYGHAGQTFGFQSYMSSLPNGYRFALVIDDAAVSSWNPAISFTLVLSKMN